MATQFSTGDNRPWKTPFFTIWTGQALSILGSQLVQFALIWHLTVTTGSATALATATLVGLLPGVLLGPLVGTLIDRWNRRATMLLADSVVAFATIVLAVLFALDIAALWHIYLVMFIRSLAGSFHGNAMSASTSLMVPAEHLTRIQGVNQMLSGGLSVVSAPLGAMLLNVIPIQGILTIDVSTAALAILPLCFFQVPQPKRIEKGPKQIEAQPTIWQDFKAGVQYLLAWPGLLVVSLMTVGVCFTIIPAFSLLPLLVKDYFGGEAVHLGWVESAMGLGVIAGGALLGVWGGFRRKIATSMLGLMGMGIGALTLAVAPESALTLAIGGAFIIGLTNALTIGPLFALVQSSVEPNFQARIFTLLGSLGGVMVPAGLVIAGPVADRFGIQTWFLLGGLLCVLMAVLGLLAPTVYYLEDRTQPHFKADRLYLTT